MTNRPKIALITCTGDRPVALTLCRKFLERSTVLPEQWIVVDDGQQPLSTQSVLTGADCVYVRRLPQSDDPPHTLPLNVLEALRHLKDEIEWIVFWEDDDWYEPRYLACVLNMRRCVPDAVIVGQSRAPYYRLVAREWQDMGNERHASLCATAIHVSLVPLLTDICAHTIDPFIDMRLWAHTRTAERTGALLAHPFCVGIKQLPGRPGRTYGWRGGDGFVSDPECRKLIQWVGREDAEEYMRIVGGACLCK